MNDLENCKKNLHDLIAETQNKLNWSSGNFSWEKAYICSLVSYATYAHIPEFEVEEANRLNIIVPCEEYRSIYRAQMYAEAMQVYQNLEPEGLYSFTLIIREMLIALVVQTPSVIFVGIRGTENKFRAFIKDWLVNLEASMIRYPGSKKALFHRGFYNAVMSIYDEVINIVSNLPRLPIYITGHSLGGAMAAILNARWLNDISQAQEFRRYSYDQKMVEPISCYVFGMPRYGNPYVINNFPSPFHVYNQRDGVPTIPPRFFGYSDIPSAHEFCLSEKNAQPISGYKKGSAFLRFADHKVEFLGVPAHFMECYVSNLRALHEGIKNPPRLREEYDCIITDGICVEKNQS